MKESKSTAIGSSDTKDRFKQAGGIQSILVFQQNGRAESKIKGIRAFGEGLFCLEVQFFCTADPSGWNPIYGKSPVHFAAELHRAAFIKALDSLYDIQPAHKPARVGPNVANL